jgi:hypothetical protein
VRRAVTTDHVDNSALVKRYVTEIDE